MKPLPASPADLYAIAQSLERGSAERYAELADSFDMSCNAEAARAFRALADEAGGRADDFGVLPPPSFQPFDDIDPDISDPDAVHYLMHAWHVFDLALRHEQKALAFFADLAAQPLPADLARTAISLVERAAAQVSATLTRRDHCDMPPADWDHDEDPPNWDM